MSKAMGRLAGPLSPTIGFQGAGPFLRGFAIRRVTVFSARCGRRSPAHQERDSVLPLRTAQRRTPRVTAAHAPSALLAGPGR